MKMLDCELCSLEDSGLEEIRNIRRFGDCSKSGTGLENVGGVCEIIEDLFDGEDSRYETN
jgi:hypothetical protein